VDRFRSQRDGRSLHLPLELAIESRLEASDCSLHNGVLAGRSWCEKDGPEWRTNISGGKWESR
jgi:hypothetical protein